MTKGKMTKEKEKEILLGILNSWVIPTNLKVPIFTESFKGLEPLKRKFAMQCAWRAVREADIAPLTAFMEKAEKGLEEGRYEVDAPQDPDKAFKMLNIMHDRLKESGVWHHDDASLSAYWSATAAAESRLHTAVDKAADCFGKAAVAKIIAEGAIMENARAFVFEEAVREEQEKQLFLLKELLEEE